MFFTVEIYLHLTGKPNVPEVNVTSPVFEGETAVLTCHSQQQQTEATKYTWNTPTDEHKYTAWRIVIPEVNRTAAGNYTCNASNVAGDTVSPPIHLVVMCKSSLKVLTFPCRFEFKWC